MGVGIIGLGVVGATMYRAFEAARLEVFGYDIDVARCQNGLDDTLCQDLVLISLPTPSSAEGCCDLSAIDFVLQRAAELKVSGSVVLRSTVPVGTTDGFLAKYPRLRIGISPEFLRSLSADYDFLNPSMTIYGGEHPEAFFEAIKLVSTRDHPHIVMTPSESELVKLFLNSFAAVKAVFASELAGLASSVNADWDKIVEAAVLDGRLGDGYLAATGPDQLPGIGGSCLPKDARMLARQLGPGSLLDAALKVNNRLRASSGKTGG